MATVSGLIYQQPKYINIHYARSLVRIQPSGSSRVDRHVKVLVYWGLTPQQQPGSYRGGDYDDEMSVLLVEETGAPGGNHRPTASN